MIRGELDLELGKFNAKLAEAVNKAARAKQQMRGATGGNSGFGEMGNDLASAFGVGPLRSLSTWVGGFAAAGVGAKALLSSVDDLADTATRLGETPETVQRVGEAARLSGSSVEGLASTMLKLEKNLGDVSNSGATEALARYGLTAEGLAAMPLDQKILAMADAFQRARADGRGYADLLALVGRSGAELIPLLAQSRDELEGLFDSVNVVSNAAVAQMAAANDAIDATLNSWSNRAKTAAYDFLNLGEVLVGLGKGKSLEEVFGDIATREMEAMSKMDKLAEERKSRAAGMGRDREAAAAAAAEKTAAEQGKAADKSLDKAKEKLAGRQAQGMDDPQRLEAMGAELKTIFDEMHQKGGLFFDQTTEGLGKWAASLEKSGHKELAAEVLGMQERALGLQQEQAKIVSGMREKAADEAKKKAEEVARLRETTEEGATKLLSPEEQAAQLRSELANSFGFEIKSGADVKTGLANLQKEADDAAARGDTEGEKSALQRLSEAQGDASDLAGLSQSPQRASLAGETAGAIGLLLGRSGSDLVLDESKRQTQTLDRIQRVLENIDRSTRNENDGFGNDF